MITLHKLNGSEFSINAELVEAVEAIPDTRITLITGNQYIVKEPVDSVIEKTVKKILSRLDHKDLNTISFFKRSNPTSEHIARYIYTTAVRTIKGRNIQIINVKVWESDTSCAVYIPRSSTARGRDR